MAAEIEEKRLARLAEAPYCPFTATVTSVVLAATVLDAAGCPLRWEAVHSDSVPNDADGPRPRGAVAYMALKMIRDFIGYENAVVANMNPGIFSMQCAKLVGLNIREKLQLLAVDAMRYCADQGIPFSVPPACWSHPNFMPPIWCDPYDAVVPSDQRQWVKYEQLASYLHIPQPLQDMENNAEAQIEFAWQIAKAANL